MKKSLIKERVEKLKSCPNCKATEKYGKFEVVKQFLSSETGKMTEEECPSCGAHVLFGDEIKPHTITIAELLETDNTFRQMLMICPELNKLVRQQLILQENSKHLAI